MKKIIYILMLFFPLMVFSQPHNNGYKKIFNKKNFSLKYKIINQNIYFSITAKTTGWVSIGINPEKVMKGANIIIGYVKHSKVFIFDHYGTRPISHKPDISLGGKDNITQKKGYEKNGFTHLEFAIPLNSGDQYDKIIYLNKPTTLLFAYGKSDNIKKRHTYVKKIKVVFK